MYFPDFIEPDAGTRRIRLQLKHMKACLLFSVEISKGTFQVSSGYLMMARTLFPGPRYSREWKL